MTNEGLMEDREVRECYRHLDKFIDIYPKDKITDGLQWVNNIPDNVAVTIYCKSKDEEGFLINTTTTDAGLTLLIAEKWILHSDLTKLVNDTI